MIRHDVAADLRGRRSSDGYLLPSYDDYCFGGVTATAASVLGVDLGRTLPADVFEGVETDVRNVVVVLVDGFGFGRFVDLRDDHPFLDALASRGTVTPLTSMYPSETAAAVTTLHTASLPVEHGLLGWNLYVEEADLVFQPLPFRTPDGRNPADVAGRELDGDLVVAADPVYPTLRREGVSPTTIQPSGTVGTPYSSHTLAGAQQLGYSNVPDAALKLRQRLEADGDDRRYVLGYVPTVDSAAHREGVRSDRYRSQALAVCDVLRRELVDSLDPDVAAETLLVLTADHGLLDTDPAEQVDLLGFDVVADSLRTDAAGEPIPPVGSPRNVHLHLREGTAATVRDALSARLDARVYTRGEALDAGLFGDAAPGPTFERRCGDVVLTHRSRQVWYDDPNRSSFVGVHGGLHPDEMLVPFAAVRLGDLQ
ncbi:MAG: alkaline phosphatase family protein [Haloferacaceae archaeon]